MGAGSPECGPVQSRVQSMFSNWPSLLSLMIEVEIDLIKASYRQV